VEDDLCVECGLPLEVEGEVDLAGAGFGPPGTECVVTMQKVRCWGEHWYYREVGSAEL
jgi:hypothetical protein